MKDGPYQQETFSNILKNKKNILFDCFMQGATTERKMTPKDFRDMTRVKLEPYEYAEERPICALFS